MSNGTWSVKAACAVAFCLFAFLFLYYFHYPTLTLMQHYWSNGQTHYDRSIGAILITLTLFLLQIGVGFLTKLHGRFHVVNYIPSFFLMGFITDISEKMDMREGIVVWYWLMPLFLLLYAGLVYFLKRVDFLLHGYTDKIDVPKALWANLLFVFVSGLLTALFSNTDKVFWYRNVAEVALSENDFDKVLSLGVNDLESDSCLTMLRAYALARKGQLGDRFFKYTVAGKSDCLLPREEGAHCNYYDNEEIFRFLGAKPVKGLKTKRFLTLLIQRDTVNSAAADYLLTAHLIDKDLDGFAAALVRYYPVGEELPQHYREALLLYTHLRSNPVVAYSNAVMDADFKGFQDLGRKYASFNERKLAVLKQYYGTYWWYYEYC